MRGEADGAGAGAGGEMETRRAVGGGSEGVMWDRAMGDVWSVVYAFGMFGGRVIGVLGDGLGEFGCVLCWIRVCVYVCV